MKKLLVLCIFLIPIPVIALCPIDIDNESVCSVSGMEKNSLPLFQNPNLGINNSQEINNPRESSLNNTLPTSKDSIMKYNSGCQFGTCVQDSNNIKNQNQ